MTRVLSALVLLPVVIGAVWFLPPVATLALASIAAVLAFVEYAGILAALDIHIPRTVTAIAVVAACVGVGLSLVSVGPAADERGDRVRRARGRGRCSRAHGPSHESVAMIFPVAYIGLPLGALAAVRALSGREAVLLLMITIVVSDSAQYYCGRAFGRRPLAPTISPKKTLEGAIGGLIFGTAAMMVGARWVFPDANLGLLALVSAAIAALGMVGDLFESLLKRSAGVKDSSNIIPGHGGVLDRIDSWLFAAPVYYAFVRFMHI